VSPLVLSDDDVVALYRVLKPLEMNLPGPVTMILNRMENRLYKTLTIAEIESLSSSRQG